MIVVDLARFHRDGDVHGLESAPGRHGDRQTRRAVRRTRVPAGPASNDQTTSCWRVVGRVDERDDDVEQLANGADDAADQATEQALRRLCRRRVEVALARLSRDRRIRR